MLGYYQRLPPGARVCDLRGRATGRHERIFVADSEPKGDGRLFRQRQGARHREGGFGFGLRFLRLSAGQRQGVLPSNDGPIALIVNAG